MMQKMTKEMKYFIKEMKDWNDTRFEIKNGKLIISSNILGPSLEHDFDGTTLDDLIEKVDILPGADYQTMHGFVEQVFPEESDIMKDKLTKAFFRDAAALKAACHIVADEAREKYGGK